MESEQGAARRRGSDACPERRALRPARGDHRSHDPPHCAGHLPRLPRPDPHEPSGSSSGGEWALLVIAGGLGVSHGPANTDWGRARWPRQTWRRSTGGCRAIRWRPPRSRLWCGRVGGRWRAAGHGCSAHGSFADIAVVKKTPAAPWNTWVSRSGR